MFRKHLCRTPLVAFFLFVMTGCLVVNHHNSWTSSNSDPDSAPTNRLQRVLPVMSRCEVLLVLGTRSTDLSGVNQLVRMVVLSTLTA